MTRPLVTLSEAHLDMIHGNGWTQQEQEAVFAQARAAIDLREALALLYDAHNGPGGSIQRRMQFVAREKAKEALERVGNG